MCSLKLLTAFSNSTSDSNLVLKISELHSIGQNSALQDQFSPVLLATNYVSQCAT